MRDKSKTCDNCEYSSLSIGFEPCQSCAYHIKDGFEAAENSDNAEVDTVPDQEYPAIRDSGERREFETGAVRDCAEGKGRADLLPLDVVADYLAHWIAVAEDNRRMTALYIFDDLERFMMSKDVKWLHRALNEFCVMSYSGDFETMMLELAKHYEEGAKKYAERNWEKGIPAHCYIDSAVRHLLKHMRGDTDEPHDRAFVWNVFGLIWTMKHQPECDDLPKVEDGNAD